MTIKLTCQEAVDLLAEIILPYKDHDRGARIEEAQRMAIEALGGLAEEGKGIHRCQ